MFHGCKHFKPLFSCGIILRVLSQDICNYREWSADAIKSIACRHRCCFVKGGVLSGTNRCQDGNSCTIECMRHIHMSYAISSDSHIFGLCVTLNSLLVLFRAKVDQALIMKNCNPNKIKHVLEVLDWFRIIIWRPPTFWKKRAAPCGDDCWFCPMEIILCLLLILLFTNNVAYTYIITYYSFVTRCQVVPETLALTILILN